MIIQNYILSFDSHAYFFVEPLNLSRSLSTKQMEFLNNNTAWRHWLFFFLVNSIPLIILIKDPCREKCKLQVFFPPFQKRLSSNCSWCVRTAQSGVYTWKFSLDAWVEQRRKCSSWQHYVRRLTTLFCWLTTSLFVFKLHRWCYFTFKAAINVASRKCILQQYMSFWMFMTSFLSR